MADALNAGELALLDLVESDIRAASEGPGGSKLLLRDIIQLAGIARRLVSEVDRLREIDKATTDRLGDANALLRNSNAEVERLRGQVEELRARNEALERVARAASILASDVNDYLDDEDAELPDPSPTFQALSAIYSSETPNSSGGGA